MMKDLKILLPLLLIVSTLSAQTIRVVDKSDLKPVENVLIYNQSAHKSSLTNRNGIAPIAGLNPQDTLLFQHPAYQAARMVYSSVQQAHGIVYLTIRAFELEQVEVTATRWEQATKELPMKISTLTSREAEFQNPQTTADLLAQIPGIYVQKSQLGGGSPMLRGFAANRVLLVIDGVRMNNAIYRSGNLQNVITLDAAVVDKTEVIFGPGSVIYGSDALGGVMSFTTHLPPISRSDSVQFRVRPMMRCGTVNDEQTLGLSIEGDHKYIAWSTHFTRSGFGDLKAGKKRSDALGDFGLRKEYAAWTGKKDSIVTLTDQSVMAPSRYSQMNFTQKVRYKPGNASEFQYGFHYSTSSDIPRYDRLIEYRSGKLRFGDWYYGPQRWMMHHFQYRAANIARWASEAKITLAYQFNEESRHDRRLASAVRTSRIEKVDALTLNADFRKSFSASINLLYGLEGIYNNVNSSAYSINLLTQKTDKASTRYPDGKNTYGSAAFYTFGTWKANRLLNLTGGLRYSYTALNSTLSDTTFYKFPFSTIDVSADALTGSAGLVLQPFAGCFFKANFATGFRAPNLDDTGKIFESAPGVVVVPNPSLKPEYSINYEGSLVVAGSKWMRAEFTAFYTRLVDAMVRRDFLFNGKDSIIYGGQLSRVQAVVNTGKGVIYGCSAGIGISMPEGLSIRSVLTFIKSFEAGTMLKVPLQHTPPLFGTTAVSYDRRRLRVEASVIHHAAKKWEDLDPGEQAKTFIYTPRGSLAWYTANLKASYQIRPTVNVSAGVENIFDRFYWPYSSGIAGPGRNMFIAVRGSF